MTKVSDGLLIGFIDPPGPFASRTDCERFLESAKKLSPGPAKTYAVMRARKALKYAKEREAKRQSK
jgi:hypothetical protein